MKSSEITIKDLTVRELHDLLIDTITETIISQLQKPKEYPKTSDNKRYVYGLQGLANLLNCSKVTASRIKQSGKIDKAISQYGKTIVIDADLAVELLGRANRRM